VRLPGSLEERDGQHHVELVGQRRKAAQERVPIDLMCEREQLLALELRKV
jgi:hypothetical protein